jgi:hypothetical protein
MAAMSVKTVYWRRQSRNLAEETMLVVPSREAFCSHTITRRSGSSHGNGRSRTAWAALKIAVLAPMPRASVATATAVKPGARRSCRRPYRTSDHGSASMWLLLPPSAGQPTAEEGSTA